MPPRRLRATRSSPRVGSATAGVATFEVRLREVRFEEGYPRQSLSEHWVERSFGHLGLVVALEYAVRRAIKTTNRTPTSKN